MVPLWVWRLLLQMFSKRRLLFPQVSHCRLLFLQVSQRVHLKIMHSWGLEALVWLLGMRSVDLLKLMFQLVVTSKGPGGHQARIQSCSCSRGPCSKL